MSKRLSVVFPKTPNFQFRNKLKRLSILDNESGILNDKNIIEKGDVRRNSRNLSGTPSKPIIYHLQSDANSRMKIRASDSKNSFFANISRNTKSGTQSTMSTLNKKRAKWQIQIDKFLDSTPVLLCMSLLTIYTLFASDVQAAWLRVEVDTALNIVPCIFMAIFFIEFGLNCIAKRDYMFSFFFWLDLISNISMIQDIDYIMDPILNYGSTSGGGGKQSVQAAKAVLKVSSASRATRVLRVIRIIRLIRMVKLYKSVSIARENAEKMKAQLRQEELLKKEKELHSVNTSSANSSKAIAEFRKTDYSTTTKIQSNYHSDNIEEGKRQSNHAMLPMDEHDNKKEIISIPDIAPSPQKLIKRISIKESKDENTNDEEETIKESKISKIVSEAITKKVIVLILTLLIIFPLISEDFYSDDSSITYYLIAQILANDIGLDGHIFKKNEVYLAELFDSDFPALNITYNTTRTIFTNSNYTNNYFRFKEVRQIYSDDGMIEISYSILTETSMTGWLNVIQTFFVCFCLVIASISFEKQADQLVLKPLEIMIEIVETVAKDPINAKNVDNLQTGIKATISKNESNDENIYEILVIKSAIIKISALLAIGFGEAGGEIIEKNLSSNSDLNPRMKGKMKTAIFGFCDIRQFEDITLALEEKTMVYVNEIAEIVHSSVDLFGGATNKNIGEAFLNVWKFYNESLIKNPSGQVTKKIQRKDNLLEIDPANPQVAITADSAVCAFLRVILKINKRCNILDYGRNPALLDRIKDYKLNMGFGLHMGYGIEGAVGSSYKIDASYLSPNVNIAARLESATRQFGVPLLISGVLHKLLSPEMKTLCRYLDCVKVKGSQLPIELYTIDLNLNLPEQNKENILIMANKDKRQYYSDKKDLFKHEIELVGNVTKIILEKRSYIEMLRTKKNNQFYLLWDDGMLFYKKGNFGKAKEKFEQCLIIDPDDKPAKTLLSYFKSCKYESPLGWDGTRELLSK